MQLKPYKPAQGVYARLSLVAVAAVLLFFAGWRTTRFVGLEEVFSVLGMSVPYGAIWGTVVFVISGCVVALFLGAFRTGVKAIDVATANFVDLLIDTESELNKVAWPGREELRRYTIVVIVCILLIGGLIYSADIVISYTMRAVEVLP